MIYESNEKHPKIFLPSLNARLDTLERMTSVNKRSLFTSQIKSPDLNYVIYFCVGYMKHHVYEPAQNTQKT